MNIANTVTDFYAGQRVESHPATDLWMRGARFGTVMTLTKTRVAVKFDRLPTKVRMNPANLRDAS